MCRVQLRDREREMGQFSPPESPRPAAPGGAEVSRRAGRRPRGKQKNIYGLPGVGRAGERGPSPCRPSESSHPRVFLKRRGREGAERLESSSASLEPSGFPQSKGRPCSGSCNVHLILSRPLHLPSSATGKRAVTVPHPLPLPSQTPGTPAFPGGSKGDTGTQAP